MMQMDLTNFLHSLAIWMAAQSQANTGLAISYAAAPRGLMIWEASENAAAAVYSVLRIWGGEKVIADPQARISLQCDTRSSNGSTAAAAGQAAALMETLLCQPTDLLPGTARRNLLVPGYVYPATDAAGDGHWRIVSATPDRPKLIGRDERGRPMVVFNCDFGLIKQA